MTTRPTSTPAPDDSPPTHPCPAEGCTRQLPHNLLFCATHWRQVPPAMQQAITAAWRRGHPAEMDHYLRVRQDAIDLVNGRAQRVRTPAPVVCAKCGTPMTPGVPFVMRTTGTATDGGMRLLCLACASTTP